MRLVSFDIDGTLEVGSPPGAISLAVVRRAHALGWVIGSCSDRPVSHQQRLWTVHGVPMHFTVLKQQLPPFAARRPGTSRVRSSGTPAAPTSSASWRYCDACA